MSSVPQCRTILVHHFHGDRTRAFTQRVFRALDDEQHGRGAGPTGIDCLLLAGHTGVSTDSDPTIYGFNPDGGTDPVWQVMQQLRHGETYPGVVRDDGPVFAAAHNQGLTILTFSIILPEPGFLAFEASLACERVRSQFSYGFPDGDGDCNCITWLERLGLPLLSGRMDEFNTVSGVAAQAMRRFGLCS